MKCMLAQRVLTTVVLVVLALPPMAQAGICRLSFNMLNSTRHVVGEVNTECSWPRAPFGNWGVDSNFGGRVDGTQFTGWKWTDNKYQWDSCTSEHTREDGVSCLYYNHDHNGNGYCEDQGSNAEYSYAGFSVDYSVSCPFDSNYDRHCDTGGCLNVNNFSVSGQYLTLYELDDYWFDDYVGNLSVHSGCCAIYGLGCSARYCEQPRYSSMYPTVSYYPGSLNTTTNVRMKLVWGEFIDNTGYCEQRGYMDIRYHCDE